MPTTRERQARAVAVLTPSRDGERPTVDAVAHPSIDIVEQWGLQSFPASDPPSNW